MTETTRKSAHVAIVLDRSGSMESCRDATISGFNQYLSGIRKTAEEQGLDTRITFTTFNGEVVLEHFNAPLQTLRPLDRERYVPDGSTAMLDAVGVTLGRLEKDLPDAPTAFLVCIISDGYENASHRFTYADVAEEIQQLTTRGNWTFTYLGSNQDLSKLSAEMGIPRGNMAAYAATPAGTPRAWEAHTRHSADMIQDISRGTPSSAAFYGGPEVADLTEPDEMS